MFERRGGVPRILGDLGSGLQKRIPPGAPAGVRRRPLEHLVHRHLLLDGLRVKGSVARDMAVLGKAEVVEAQVAVNTWRPRKVTTILVPAAAVKCPLMSSSANPPCETARRRISFESDSTAIEYGTRSVPAVYPPAQ